jgi:predicted Zn-dependent protease
MLNSVSKVARQTAARLGALHTIDVNLKDMFMNIIAIGSDVDLRGVIKTGSVLIDKMQVAGN